MKFLNIELAGLRTPEFLLEAPSSVGTWFALLAFCADVENSGRIAGARHWDDRQWLVVVGQTKADIDRTCGLWRWDGDDLVVSHYPLQHEQRCVQNRASASKGGRSTSPSKIAAVQRNGCLGGAPRKPSAAVIPDAGAKDLFGNLSGNLSAGQSENLTEDKGKSKGRIHTSAEAREIYDHYPRKVARGRALKAIDRALTKVDPATLRAAVIAFADAVGKWPEESRHFVPHPASWFNDERWTDDPSTWERDPSVPAGTAPSRPSVMATLFPGRRLQARNGEAQAS